MKIKVKLSAWWCESPEIHDRLRYQFIGNVFPDENIEFTNSDDYDFLIICGCRNEKDLNIKVDKDHVIYFSMEPFWSSRRIDKDASEVSSRVFVTNKDDFHKQPEYIESHVYIPYDGHGRHNYHPEAKYKWSIDHILGDNTTRRNSLACIVQSKSSWPETDHPRLLYSDREALAKTIALKKCDEIQIWGKYWNIDDGNTYYNVHGPATNKMDILESCYFNITIESTAEKNYITEKFWDSILTETIPIYSGPPNIREIVPYDCYLLIPDTQDISGTIKFIKENATKDFYHSLKSELRDLKREYLSNLKYSLWQRIRHEIYKES